MNAANLRLVAIRSAELGDTAVDTVVDNAGDVVDTVVDSEAGKSLADTVLDTLSNKFVIGGLVAVTATAVGYGIYRWMKKDDKPAATPAATPAAKAAPVAPEMTTEEMVLKARELLTTAETRLKDSKKNDTPATAKAA